jgi:hypothetical protein
MPSKHERIVEAVRAAIAARVLADIGAEVSVIRSAPEEQMIEAARFGVVNIAEQDTVETDRVFGVARRFMQTVLIAEVVVPGHTPSVRDARLDAVYRSIGAAIAADLKLGGLADYVDIGGPGAPINALWQGASDIKAGSIGIAVEYSTGEDPMADD